MEQNKHLSVSLEPHCDNVAQHQLLYSICYFNCRPTEAPCPHSLVDNPVWRRDLPITMKNVSLVESLDLLF